VVPQNSACLGTVVARGNRTVWTHLIGGKSVLRQHASAQFRCVMTVTGTDGLIVDGEEQLPWTTT
jgi:hypothetical protein